MSTITAPVRTATTTRSARPRPWLATAGAASFVAATAIIFFSLPHASGTDAAAKIAAFYGEGGRSGVVPVSEPFALIGAFLMLWFGANLRDHLRQAGGDDRRATVAFAGVLTFSILLSTALLIQATPAGQLAFSDGFRLDPYTAMLFHHVGYVLLVAAMVCAAVAAAATATVMRDIQLLGAWASRTGIAVAVLSLLALPFVYAPLVAFLAWAAVIGWRLPAALADR